MNVCISKRRLGLIGRFSSWGSTRPAWFLVVVGFPLALSPSVLQGQGSGPTSESWTVGVAGGVFHYELAQDQGSPIFVVRADRPASKWVRFEVGASHTRPEVQTDAQSVFDPSLPAEYTNLFTATVGLQFRWTLGPLEPYAGIAGGFFGRYDGGPTARRFGRSTFQFPFGIRLWATDHIGVRAEYRFDEDSHEAKTRSDNEMTAGVFWTF